MSTVDTSGRTDDRKATVMKDLRGALSALLRGMKMYSLYPEKHINRRQAVERLHGDIFAFLSAHGSLLFEVDKDRLLFRGEEVYRGASRDGDFVFAMFRDGIECIEIKEEIDLWELETLLNTLHLYRSLPEESEDDLVTALWEAQLPHVKYEAVDKTLEGDYRAGVSDPGAGGPRFGGGVKSVDDFLPGPGILEIPEKSLPDAGDDPANALTPEGDPLPTEDPPPDGEAAPRAGVVATSAAIAQDLEASSMNRKERLDRIAEAGAKKEDESPDRGTPGDAGAESAQEEDLEIDFDPPEAPAPGKKSDPSSKDKDYADFVSKLDGSVLGITPEESETLREMAHQEDYRDVTREVLEMLVGILENKAEAEFFAVILKFLQEAFEEALGSTQFHTTHKILSGMRYIREKCEQERSWALPQLDVFFVRLSGDASLGPMEERLPLYDLDQLDGLRKTLCILSPIAIRPLAPMLLHTSLPAPKQMLTDVICTLLERDLTPLEALIDSSDADLLELMCGILDHVDSKDLTDVLVRLARNSSERVVKAALDTLWKRGTYIPDRLFTLIESQNPIIRRLFLRYLSMQKNHVAEVLITEHLEGAGARKFDREHLIGCFETLGACGSANSVPFLRNCLMGGNPLSKFFKSAKREGAAIALGTLKAAEAVQTLAEASSSFFRGVRTAATIGFAKSAKPGDPR